MFVGVESPAGPVELLRVVLQLAKRSATLTDSHHLSALDELYTLVMERVSPTMLLTVQWILLTTRVPDVVYAHQSANLSGLTEVQWKSTSACLHSVMKVGEVGEGHEGRIIFYHASFMDFIGDPTRSGRFYIWSDCAVALLEEVLRALDQISVDPGASSKKHISCSRIFLNLNIKVHQAAIIFDLTTLGWSQKLRNPIQIISAPFSKFSLVFL